MLTISGNNVIAYLIFYFKENASSVSELSIVLAFSLTSLSLSITIALYQFFHEDINSASSRRILALCNFNLWIKVFLNFSTVFYYIVMFLFCLF